MNALFDIFLEYRLYICGLRAYRDYNINRSSFYFLASTKVLEGSNIYERTI